MKKKIASIVLSLAVVFTSIVPAMAADPKSNFIKAIEKTNKTLATESKITEDADIARVIYENLVSNAYQTSLAFGINDVQGSGLESLAKLKLENTQKVNPENNSVLNELLLQIPAALANTSKDVNLNVNLFLSENQLGFNVPQVAEGYYYINPQTFVSDWNKSEYGKQYPITAEEAAQIAVLKDAIANSKVDYAKLKIAAKDLNKPYQKLFTKYLARGYFTTDGEKLVPSQRGQIVTNKIDFVLNEQIANEFLQELSDTIRNDKGLYNYLSMCYAPLDNNPALTDSMGLDTTFTQYIIDTYADAIMQLAVKGNFVYSIYTNQSNQIYRTELNFGFDDGYSEEPIKMSVTLDTKGKDYLGDEIYLAVLADNGETKAGFDFSLNGNIIPRDGATNGQFSMNVKQGYGDAVQSMNIFKGDYSYNAKATADNFSFNAKLSQELGMGDASLSMTGDVNLNQDKTVVELNLKSVQVKMDDYLIDFYLKVKSEPIDGSTVAMPKDAKKLTDLSADELNTLMDSAEKNLLSFE